MKNYRNMSKNVNNHFNNNKKEKKNYDINREIINGIIHNKSVPVHARLYIYFLFLEKYDKRIYAKNPYLAQYLSVSTSAVQKGLKKLKNAELVYIQNKGSWKREIFLNMDSKNSNNDVFKDLLIPDYDWLNDRGEDNEKE